MPIFELEEKTLVPFRQQAIGAGVYEAEIEDLLWDNLEELTGDNLFRVARQPVLPLGRPDVIALDPTGRVVVIEVKRDVDRNQLAQALEYAGWARNVGLDELAQRYHGGPQSFWEDWMEFTDSEVPRLIVRDPRLVLVARNFEPRTYEALEFLLQHNLPIKLLKLAFYIDDAEGGRRFLNVEWESEPEVSAPVLPAAAPAASAVLVVAAEPGTRDFREVTLTEVAESVSTPAQLIWNRPKKGEKHEATLLANGKIRLSDGREFGSPSGAAMGAADVVSYDGWYAWRLATDGRTLNQIRQAIAHPATPGDNGSGTLHGPDLQLNFAN
ncbi:hypothetical protein GCM10009609_43830 [Pseudonocardia aurantiaca]|uniref:RAMA domain-containing protein n=1 Tax=Pseudonocardia aurantiaca TaxID=75290 RepID=A0ABW4FYS8_9PSEU